MKRWVPSLVDRFVNQRTPPVGVLIGEQHRIWRVTETPRVAPDEWTESDRAEWERARCPDPDTWDRAPVRVLAMPVGSDRLHSMTVSATTFVRRWAIVPEHYAVCSKCGDPAPCKEYLYDQESQERMKAAERAMELPDGFCPACREPITSRQKAYRFPGENLLNPLGAPTVRFHARRKCRSAAAAYEERWVAADPGRQRSVLTLRCSGRLEVHADGSAECHGSEDCPTVYAQHNYVYACVALSDGCGKGCTYAEHHGVRLARNLTPGGDHRLA